MNKKLGALALLGASAVVLAGCSGGGTAEPTTSDAATGDLTVWLVGADTPDTARQYLKDTFEAENEVLLTIQKVIERESVISLDPILVVADPVC